MSITSTAINTTSNSTGSVSNSSSGSSASQQLAGNFDTFLQLLTTQLQNQDPLSPLDTNSFTQELVEFASVEQQINTNTNMQTLISLQQTGATTSALQLVGSTVTLSGNSATLSNATNSPATWSLTVPNPATANVTITNSSGQTAYTGTVSLNAGTQSYTWNGQGTNGTTWPDGTYTLSITATGANGQSVPVSTQVQGVVSGVDMTQTPPTLTVGGSSYPITAVQSINNGSLTSGISSLNSSISSLNSSLNSSISSLNSVIGTLSKYL